MGNYEELKQAVSDVIKSNGNQEITGSILQNALLSIISTVGANATFAGIATPDTNPGTPDQNLFYIASESGKYVNFGNLVVKRFGLIINKNNAWQFLGLNIPKMSDIRQNVYVTTKPIEVSTTRRTIKIPAQSLTLNSKGLATLSNDVTLDLSYETWGTYHVIYDDEVKTFKALSSRNNKPILSDNQYYFATIRFYLGGYVFDINALSYIIDGIEYTKQNYLPLSDKTDVYDTEIISSYSGSPFKPFRTKKTPGFLIITPMETYPKKYSIFVAPGLTNEGYKSVGVMDEVEKDKKFIYYLDEQYNACLNIRLGDSAGLSGKRFRVQFMDFASYFSNIQNNSSSKVVAPCMYNPKFDFKKETIKILDIGNSYTLDATHYIPEIVEASGIDVSNMCLYSTYRGSGSFKNWYDIYNNKDSAVYEVKKIIGGLTADTSGEAAPYNGEKFRNTLTNNKWDLIIIHQYSGYSTNFEQWEGNTNAGYLNELIRIIRKHQPQAAIGFLLVHSYSSNYAGNLEGSSYLRWKLIVEATEKLRAKYGIDFIIPYGTAIQNMRESSFNNDNDLTEDGSHCADGLANYTAACCYFQSIFGLMYDTTIIGNTARISEGTPPVTDDNALIAQKAAYIATYNWYKTFNPENIII